MKKPSKKEIKEAIAKLKEQNSLSETRSAPQSDAKGKLSEQKSSQRIRKQGV